MTKNQKRAAKSTAGKPTKGRKTKRAGAKKQRPTGNAKKSTSSKGRGGQKTKKSGKSSSYNLYMKHALSQVKAENPNLSHPEAFKKAAQQWSTSPENPKNK